MKPTIYSITVNDCFPIDIQFKQFKKFCTDDHDFVLLNDAYDPAIEARINTLAAANAIRCVRVPQDIHPQNNPSEALGQTLNWIVRSLAPRDRMIMMVHTDVFPINYVSIGGILANHAVAGTLESKILNDRRVNYIYPALTIIDMARVDPNELDFGLQVGLDTGGNTYRFVDKYPERVKFLPHHQAYNVARTLNPGDPFCQYLNADVAICRQYEINAGWIAEGFYHYLAGSRWNASSAAPMQGHEKRMKLFMGLFGEPVPEPKIQLDTTIHES